MKNKMRFLTLAALAVVAVMMTGCTKENGGSMTLTTTVKMADDGAKALDADGVKTFAAGEQIAVVYTKTNGQTEKAVSDALTADDISGNGKVANFTVDLTDPDREQDITYIYPAAMANDDGSVNNAALNNQDGTLATLSSSLDLGTYTGSWNSTVTLTNGIAIGQFTIQNISGNDITSTITSLTVTNGTNTYTVTRSDAADTIYVAMLPVNNGNIELTATCSTKYVNYVKTVTGKTLAAGHLYPVTVRMDKQINLDSLNSHYEAHNGDILTGTLARGYKISVNTDGATVTLRNATITGTTGTNNENYQWAGINCGDNTTLVIEGTNNVTGFYEDYPGIHIASGKTLTIQGTGTLNASSYGGANGWGAGIGGSDLVDCGNIVINSGTINATGGIWMAGIGSGFNKNCGSITINGGKVTATGGPGAAGIGTGVAQTDISCGNISITGGTVEATGGRGAAGIGSGFVTYNGKHNTCGNIRITGGQVRATGGDGGNVYPDIFNDQSWAGYTYYGGAGIGTGSTSNYYDAGSSSCGTITIGSGVTSVTAYKGGGNYPATNSIGENESTSNQGSCPAVTIGDTQYWSHNIMTGGVYQNGGDTYLTQSPLVYSQQ